jgi:hypothetical protein
MNPAVGWRAELAGHKPVRRGGNGEHPKGLGPLLRFVGRKSSLPSGNSWRHSTIRKKGKDPAKPDSPLRVTLNWNIGILGSNPTALKKHSLVLAFSVFSHYSTLSFAVVRDASQRIGFAMVNLLSLNQSKFFGRTKSGASCNVTLNHALNLFHGSFQGLGLRDSEPSSEWQETNYPLLSGRF